MPPLTSSEFADSEIGQLSYAGDAEGLHAYLKAKSLRSLFYFAKTVLGYKDLSEKLHLEFAEALRDTIQLRRRGFLWPRGHFKSTLMKCYALWRLCGGGKELHPIEDPRNLRIVVFGENENVGAKALKDIKWHLLNNQMLQWLFPEVIPLDINKTKWTDTEILLPRSSSFDESSITTYGVEQRVTGFHFDIMIYDDIFDEKASKSDAIAKSIEDFFQYAPGLANSQATVEELIAGTRWKYGEGDIYGWIMAHMPETVKHSADDDPTKVERETGFKWFIRRATEMSPTTGEEEPIFPERFTLDDLDAIRKRQGQYKYSCQYDNNPIPSEGVNFPPELLQDYEVRGDNLDHPAILHPLDGTPDVRLDELYRLSFYDPSSGGPSAGCESAIVGVGMAPDCRVFVLRDWGANAGYGQSVEQWFNLNDQFLFHDNYYEKVGAQKTIEEEIIPLRQLMGKCPFCDKQHRRLIPRPFQPPGGKAKDDRIFAYLDPILQDKRLYLRKGMNKLREQIITHPHSQLKDELDALASGCSLLRPPTSADQLKEEAAMDEFMQQRTSRTFLANEVGGYV